MNFMKPQDLTIAKKFKKLVSKRIPILRLIVFGSRARGDAEPESDLDLLVEVDRLEPGVRQWISECAWEAGFSEYVLVAPVVYTKEEFQYELNQFSCFLRNVLREGVTIS